MTKTKHIILIFILSIMSLASQPYSYEYQYNDGTGNKPFDERIVIGGAGMANC